MQNETHNLIARQRDRLSQLREDAQDIADTVADEVWDKFLVEATDMTEDGFMFDTASMTKTALSSGLAMDYQDAMDRHVLARFESMQKDVAETFGQAACDEIARIDLAGMRKGLKLRSYADDLIEQAIDRVKPGVGRALDVLVGGLFRDPMAEMDALEKDMKKDAVRVRRELLALRSGLRQTMSEESRSVINAARLAYAERLNKLQETLCVNAA